jgi:hypothetical protein
MRVLRSLSHRTKLKDFIGHLLCFGVIDLPERAKNKLQYITHLHMLAKPSYKPKSSDRMMQD